MSLFPLQVWHYRHRQSQDFVQGKFLQVEIKCSIAFSFSSWKEARDYDIHPLSNSPHHHALIYQGDTPCKGAEIRCVSLWREIWIIFIWLCYDFCSNLFGITCWTTTKRTRHWWKVSLNSTLLLVLLVLESFVRYAVTKEEFEFYGFVCFAGPLNNLKESMIQFSKPRKLVNRTNPVRQLLHIDNFYLDNIYSTTSVFHSKKSSLTIPYCRKFALVLMQFNLTWFDEGNCSK